MASTTLTVSSSVTRDEVVHKTAAQGDGDKGGGGLSWPVTHVHDNDVDMHAGQAKIWNCKNFHGHTDLDGKQRAG